VSIKEPWTETLDGKDVDTFEDLKHLAQVWGTVAASVHRQGAAVQNKVKSRLTPELKGQLAARAAAYAATVVPAFQAFTGDARTRKQIATADAALRELESKGR
jgi:hypothetical protein